MDFCNHMSGLQFTFRNQAGEIVENCNLICKKGKRTILTFKNFAGRLSTIFWSGEYTFKFKHRNYKSFTVRMMVGHRQSYTFCLQLK